MSYDIDSGGRRIPTLVQYCQRVASSNAENICSLGEGWRSDLIRPVLESCSPETLLRFEQADPYIATNTSDIWKRHFVKEYPIAAHQLEQDGQEEPESWRDEYFTQQDLARQRLDQLSERLRSSRMEEQERKKESAIKFTDRPPPAKRARAWGAPAPPKTLFQKTKSDTVRLQKGVFGSRYNRPTFQKQRIVPNSASAAARILPPSTSTASAAQSGSRVVVRSVPVTPKPPLPKQPSTAPSQAVNVAKPPAPSTSAFDLASSPPRPASPTNRHTMPAETGSPVRVPAKKNPAASLFMPKHRAYSQLPRGVQSKS